MNELFWFVFPLITGIISIHFFEKWSRKNKFALGIDINKLDQRKTPESTGIVVLAALWASVVLFFYLNDVNPLFLGWLLLLSVFSLVGFADDTKHKWAAKTIPWAVRAIPIALVSLAFAFFFAPSIYWVIPLALYIALIASLHNTFAGLNGWEVGSTYIISLAVVFLLAATQFLPLALILSGLILGLLLFNRFPARVFPGDSSTLLFGSAVAALFVMQKNYYFMILLLLFYLPHIIDFFVLKLLTNMRDPSQAKTRPYKVLGNERLAIPSYKDKRIRYDFAKLVIKIFGPLKEWQVVAIIWIIVAVNCVFWLIFFGMMKF
ncbi:MAG: hypothetical protein AB1467_01095 [Candidatus Diapherotrites archaeon]